MAIKKFGRINRKPQQRSVSIKILKGYEQLVRVAGKP